MTQTGHEGKKLLPQKVSCICLFKDTEINNRVYCEIHTYLHSGSIILDGQSKHIDWSECNKVTGTECENLGAFNTNSLGISPS